LKLTQRLFDHLLLIAGKINTLDGFRLNYTDGNGLDRFMNSAVVANINGRTIPYSTYGAGFAVFADQGPEFTFLVRDPDNHPTTTDQQTFCPRRVADRLVAIAGCAVRIAGHASVRRQLEQPALHIARPIRLGERSRSGSARAHHRDGEPARGCRTPLSWPSAAPVLSCLWQLHTGKSQEKRCSKIRLVLRAYCSRSLRCLVNHYFSRRERHFSIPCQPVGPSLSNTSGLRTMKVRFTFSRYLPLALAVFAACALESLRHL
jgi:hypothetical protein